MTGRLEFAAKNLQWGDYALVLAQKVPEQMPAYYEATFYSERYRDAMVRWLTLLGGKIRLSLFDCGKWWWDFVRAVISFQMQGRVPFVK